MAYYPRVRFDGAPLDRLLYENGAGERGAFISGSHAQHNGFDKGPIGFDDPREAIKAANGALLAARVGGLFSILKGEAALSSPWVAA